VHEVFKSLREVYFGSKNGSGRSGGGISEPDTYHLDCMAVLHPCSNQFAALEVNAAGQGVDGREGGGAVDVEGHVVVVDVAEGGVEGGVKLDGEEGGGGGGGLREAHREGGEMGGGGDEEGEAVAGGAGGGGEDGEGEAGGEGGGGVGLGVKKTKWVDEEGPSDGGGGAGGLVGGESDSFVGEEGVTVEGEVVGREGREGKYQGEEEDEEDEEEKWWERGTRHCKREVLEMLWLFLKKLQVSW